MLDLTGEFGGYSCSWIIFGVSIGNNSMLARAQWHFKFHNIV